MHEAKEDVLAFRHFPKDHWRKIWSTNLLERVNVAPRGALCQLLHQAPHQGRGHLPQRSGDHATRRRIAARTGWAMLREGGFACGV